jgi:RNA polymerase sigma factor (sigma-70 family)
MGGVNEIEVYDPPPENSGDYVLQFKIKNGPLLRAIRMRTSMNLTKFCEVHGLSYTTTCAYLALRYVPLTKTGKWKDSVLKLAHALRLPPDSLFPEQHLSQALKRSTGELNFSEADIRERLAPAASDPESLLIEGEKNQKLHDLLLRTLSPRELKVITKRWGLEDGQEHTLEELAEEEGVGRERIRQIERKALGKLQRPEKEKEILSFAAYPHGQWRDDPKPRHYKGCFDFDKELLAEERAYNEAVECARDKSMSALNGQHGLLHRQQDELERKTASSVRFWEKARETHQQIAHANLKDRITQVIQQRDNWAWPDFLRALGLTPQHADLVERLCHELVTEGRLWKRVV